MGGGKVLARGSRKNPNKPVHCRAKTFKINGSASVALEDKLQGGTVMGLLDYRDAGCVRLRIPVLMFL
jgi:hypothetical protein